MNKEEKALQDPRVTKKQAEKTIFPPSSEKKANNKPKKQKKPFFIFFPFLLIIALLILLFGHRVGFGKIVTLFQPVPTTNYPTPTISPNMKTVNFPTGNGLIRFDSQSLSVDEEFRLLIDTSYPGPYYSKQNLRFLFSSVAIETLEKSKAKYKDVQVSKPFYLELQSRIPLEEIHYINPETISLYYTPLGENEFKKLETAVDFDQNKISTNEAPIFEGYYAAFAELKCPNDFGEPDDEGPGRFLHVSARIESGTVYLGEQTKSLSEPFIGYFTSPKEKDWLAFRPDRNKVYQIHLSSNYKPLPKIRILKNYYGRVDLLPITPLSIKETKDGSLIEVSFKDEKTDYADNYLEGYIELTPSTDYFSDCDYAYTISIEEI